MTSLPSECVIYARFAIREHVYMLEASFYTCIMDLQITKVQEDAMEELERRLSEVKDQTGATYITETVMLQTMKTHIQQHIDSAKQQWMKLVCSVHLYGICMCSFEMCVQCRFRLMSKCFLSPYIVDSTGFVSSDRVCESAEK